MKSVALIILSLFFSTSAMAQEVASPQTATATPATSVAKDAVKEPAKEPAKEIFNQVIFADNTQSWTTRDLNLYKKVLAAYVKHDKISDYSDSVMEDFLVSRLLKSEALVFEIQPKDQFIYNAGKLSAGEYSKKEIEDELKDLSQAMALLNLREKQMTQKARFKAWIDVLKRKYQVKIKTDEFPKS